ncbi:MAG TPA: glutathione S-transferase C-terminal domain-containing protein, partial [Chloroflexota bacterium]|nr:glutathione S-transferase C-terminal domain-containing protein [Chloroflexota bacterium]
KLKKLENIVSLSYVDDERDGRGWAFRERRGPDPINGFTLLVQAYEATEPGYPGHISVPVLWDRKTGTIVSNNFPDITLDLGHAFDAWGDASIDLYPPELRAEIDAMNEYLFENINDGPYRVAGTMTEQDYEQRRQKIIDGFEQLDARLATSRYLFGDKITESDVRLWPTLARYDLFYNPLAGISERHLTDFQNLWAFARDLYQQPAFRETTDFGSFSRSPASPKPTFVNPTPWRLDIEPHQAYWNEPSHRERLG